MNKQQLIEMLPDYSSREDVARFNDLHKFLTGEMTYKEAKEKKICFKQESILEHEEIENKLIEEATREMLCDFFLFFRENGEKLIGITIEGLIDIYLKNE